MPAPWIVRVFRPRSPPARDRLGEVEGRGLQPFEAEEAAGRHEEPTGGASRVQISRNSPSSCEVEQGGT